MRNKSTSAGVELTGVRGRLINISIGIYKKKEEEIHDTHSRKRDGCIGDACERLRISSGNSKDRERRTGWEKESTRAGLSVSRRKRRGTGVDARRGKKNRGKANGARQGDKSRGGGTRVVIFVPASSLISPHLDGLPSLGPAAPRLVPSYSSSRTNKRKEASPEKTVGAVVVLVRMHISVASTY